MHPQLLLPVLKSLLTLGLIFVPHKMEELVNHTFQTLPFQALGILSINSLGRGLEVTNRRSLAQSETRLNGGNSAFCSLVNWTSSQDFV